MEFSKVAFEEDERGSIDLDSKLAVDAGEAGAG